MELEIEVKFYPVVKGKIQERLKKLGAHLSQENTLMRRVVYDRRSNPDINCTYARIRDEGTKVTVSLKVNAEAGGSIFDQKEAQIKVDNFEVAREIFKGLGLVETNYQENEREVWSYKNSEVVVDQWPSLETYIEIEGPTEKEIKEISIELGMNWEKRILVSTDELYAKKFNISKEEALKLMSNITFNNIPKAFQN